jgi:hypothetical protein
VTGQVGFVARLTRYPVTSMGGEDLASAEVEGRAWRGTGDLILRFRDGSELPLRFRLR